MAACSYLSTCFVDVSHPTYRNSFDSHAEAIHTNELCQIESNGIIVFRFYQDNSIHSTIKGTIKKLNSTKILTSPILNFNALGL